MNVNSLGFKNGTITLDNPQAIYYSGQVISGKIEFELKQELIFSAINVVFRGEASVFWTEPQTENYVGVERQVEVAYKGFEEYFNVVQCLCGGTGTSVLPSGTHSIPFNYQIPFGVPSSYNGSIGNVTYKVEAYLEGAQPSMVREDLVKTFEVVAPLDLNKEANDVKQPIEMQFEEVYSCCCSSQPVSVKVTLPVGGYCPGQDIPISIDADNNSDTEINKIIFQLKKRERYHSRSPVSEYITPETVLATMKKGPILGNTKRVYLCDMPVPDMIIPNLDNCGIIDVGYFLKVTIKLSGCNDDLHDECDLILGLLPLDISVGNSRYVHPMSHSLPIGPIPDPNNPPVLQNVTPYNVQYKSGNMDVSNSGIFAPYTDNSRVDIKIKTSTSETLPGSGFSIPSAPYPIEIKESYSYEIGFKVSLKNE